MDGKLNKKLILTIVKYGTWLIGLVYLIQIGLSCFNIQSIFLTFLFGSAVIPMILLCIFSIFLGYCYWHRFPIYCALFTNIINGIDYYIGIPITNKWIVLIYLICLFLFALIGCLIKNYKNANKRHVKENST